LGVSPVGEEEKVPTPKVPFSVVVAPYEVVRPYWKPRTVVEALPSEVMVPFSVAVDVPTEEAAWVVRVGAVMQMLVVNVASEPYEVPAEFVA